MKERISEVPLNAALEPSGGDVAYLPNLTDDELRKLAREKLSEALQAVSPSTQPELTRKLCAELMDRLDGKPGQSVTLDANIRTVTVNATIRFADEIHAPVDSNIIDHVDNVQAIENE